MKTTKILAALAILTLVYNVSAEQDMRKAIIIDMVSRQGYVQSNGVKVIYGVAPNYLPDMLEPGSLKMVAETRDKNTVWARTIMNPIYCQIDGDIDEAESHYVTLESSEFTAVIPFRKELVSFTVYDAVTGDRLTSIDLATPIADFCKKQVYDEDCGTKPQTTTTTLSTTSDSTNPPTTTTTQRSQIPVTTNPQPPSGGGIVGGIVNFFRGLFG